MIGALKPTDGMMPRWLRSAYVNFAAPTTTRQDLVEAPGAGLRLAVAHIFIAYEVEAAYRLTEFYFGTAANLAAAADDEPLAISWHSTGISHAYDHFVFPWPDWRVSPSDNQPISFRSASDAGSDAHAIAHYAIVNSNTGRIVLP